MSLRWPLALTLTLAFALTGATGDPDRRYAEDLLAAVVCAECSTCTEAEREAVAASVLHRSGSLNPRRLEAVVLAPGQYADIDHCRDDRRARRRMLPAVRQALRGADPADGATSFHARWTCRRWPSTCHHEALAECLDTVWPTLDEVPVPADWRHRFYRKEAP